MGNCVSGYYFKLLQGGVPAGCFSDEGHELTLEEETTAVAAALGIEDPLVFEETVPICQQVNAGWEDLILNPTEENIEDTDLIDDSEEITPPTLCEAIRGLQAVANYAIFHDMGSDSAHIRALEKTLTSKRLTLRKQKTLLSFFNNN